MAPDEGSWLPPHYDKLLDEHSLLGIRRQYLTYIPLAKGFVYLVAVMDWFSRRVLAWRLSTGMDTGFCVDAVQQSLYRHGSPDNFNANQGVQFTSAAFTGVLAASGIRISMDGKGRYLDNIFIERLWRSLK